MLCKHTWQGFLYRHIWVCLKATGRNGSFLWPNVLDFVYDSFALAASGAVNQLYGHFKWLIWITEKAWQRGRKSQVLHLVWFMAVEPVPSAAESGEKKIYSHLHYHPRSGERGFAFYSGWQPHRKDLLPLLLPHLLPCFVFWCWFWLLWGLEDANDEVWWCKPESPVPPS